MSGQVSQTRRTDAPGSSTPVAASPRVGGRQLERVARQLSERDLTVLRRISEHGYLTTYQIQQFAFTGHATEETAGKVTRRVLRRLKLDGLLRPVLQRVGGVRAGSSAKVWQLASAGTRLLAEEGARIRTKEPSLRFLAHTLAIADVHLLLRELARDDDVASVSVEVEPTSWRRYQGPSGERRILKPDLYAEITTSRYVDRVFIEADLGSESIRTVLGQCEQYELYRRTGAEQDRHGSFPLVIWFLPDAERARRVQKAVNLRPGLIPAMFRYATPATLSSVLRGVESEGVA